MDAFFLTFHDVHLERKFETYMAKGAFQVEKIFFFLSFFVISGYMMRLGRQGNYWQLIPMMINFANVALIFYVRKGGQEAMEKWRTPLLGCSRVLGYFGFAIAHSALTWKTKFSGNPVAIFATLLSVHHLPGALIPALGCRLKFKHHVPTRLLETCIFLFIQTPSACHLFLEAPKVADALAVERGIGILWENILDSFYSPMGVSLWRTSPKKPCLHFATYTHIVWSLGFVSYSVWWLERRWRATFLNSLRRQNNGPNVTDTDHTLPEISQSTWAMTVAHLSIMTAWSALGWELLAVLPTFNVAR